MPKDAINHIDNSFVIITINDLQRLQQHNASGLVMRVWMGLRSFCWNGKKTCFPSIATIAERIGYTGKSAQQSIGKALKWLEDNAFIKRNHKRSSDRFVMIDNIANRISETSPISERKLKTEEDELPPNPPTPGGRTTKQKKATRRLANRRKRLRKRDRLHIAEVAERQALEAEQKAKMLEDAKQAFESAPQVLEGLLTEHQTKETPETPEQATRAFLVASILRYYDWIDAPVSIPTHITSPGQMLIDQLENEELLWQLRLNLYALWKFIKRISV